MLNVRYIIYDIRLLLLLIIEAYKNILAIVPTNHSASAITFIPSVTRFFKCKFGFCNYFIAAHNRSLHWSEVTRAQKLTQHYFYTKMKWRSKWLLYIPIPTLFSHISLNRTQYYIVVYYSNQVSFNSVHEHIKKCKYGLIIGYSFKTNTLCINHSAYLNTDYYIN